METTLKTNRRQEEPSDDQPPLGTDSGTKVCSHCRETKPLSEFYRKKKKEKVQYFCYCRECYKFKRRAHCLANRNKEIKGVLDWGVRNFQRSMELKRQCGRLLTVRLRNTVLKEYGGLCWRCGDDRLDALVLHHSNGGGAIHRSEVGSGVKFWKWVVKNNFPDGL